MSDYTVTLTHGHKYLVSEPYREHPRTVPGVNEILAAVGLQRAFSTTGGVNEARAHADWCPARRGGGECQCPVSLSQEIGTHTHLACQLWESGQLDESSIEHPDVRRAWQNYVQWRTDFPRREWPIPHINGDETLPLIQEVALYHPGQDYCGTPDLAVQNGGTVRLVDIKTGSASPLAGITTWAYQQLLEYNQHGRWVPLPIIERWRLSLGRDGPGYKFSQLRNTQQEALVWSAALTIYNAQRGGYG